MATSTSNQRHVRAHIDPQLLAELIARSPHRYASRLAECHIGMSKGYMHDLLTGRRSGTSPDLRERIADTLGVPVWSFTCDCDDLTSHRPPVDA